MDEHRFAIRGGQCIVHLNGPAAFETIALASLNVWFRMLFQNDYEAVNAETIHALDDYIPDMIDEKRRLWCDASHEFRSCFRDPEQRPRDERKAVKRENDRLFHRVKAANRAWEKACKVNELYEKTKAQYQI